MARSRDDSLLYVATIGAITNVASAILMEPEIITRIVVVWLGGHALHWSDTRSSTYGRTPTRHVSSSTAAYPSSRSR